MKFSKAFKILKKGGRVRTPEFADGYYLKALFNKNTGKRDELAIVRSDDTVMPYRLEDSDLFSEEWEQL